MPIDSTNPAGGHAANQARSLASHTPKQQNARQDVPLYATQDNETSSEVKTSKVLVFVTLSGGKATGGGLQYTRNEGWVFSPAMAGGAELGVTRSNHGIQASEFQALKIQQAKAQGAQVKYEDNNPEDDDSKN